MPLLVPAMAAAVALAAILLYRWLRLLSARRRIKRGAPFIVCSATAMEEGQALLSPKSASATSAPASHLASPASTALRPAATLPAPAPAKPSSPRGQKQLVAMARARAMIQSFGLPFEPLAELLRSLGCIVAGGSMVHAYMAQPPDQFAGDLDIFCKPEHVKPLRALFKAAGYRSTGTAAATATGYSALLTSLSAAACPAADSDTAAAAAMASAPVAVPSPEELPTSYQLLGRLLRVDDFVHPESGRKVQLVVCSDPQAAPAQFDLSAAATVFDGSSLFTLYPATTDKWETFWLQYGDPRGPSRLAKYESRGFKLVPCPEGAALPPSSRSPRWASSYHAPAGAATTTG